MSDEISSEENEEFEALTKIDSIVSHPFFKEVTDQAGIALLHAFGFLNVWVEGEELKELPETIHLYGAKDGKLVELFTVNRKLPFEELKGFLNCQ